MADDLDPSRPHARQLLGERLVLWRSRAGAWQCFEDRCPHRLAPLSGAQAPSTVYNNLMWTMKLCCGQEGSQLQLCMSSAVMFALRVHAVLRLARSHPLSVC